LQGGTGGFATVATTGTNTGGSGGNITIQGGSGRSASNGATNVCGNGGDVFINSGAKGCSASGAAGRVYLKYGTASSPVIAFILDNTGNIGIGNITPTALLHIKAGTATANTAPLKLTSGTLNTTAEVGAVEFLTDAYYGTITTGAARKTFAFLESPTFTGTVTAPTIVSTVVVRLKGYTVATLPAGTQGDTAFVTDATTPTYLGALTGGGAVVTPVFYDGAVWVSY